MEQEGGGRKRRSRRESESCWRWLGIYLLYSLSTEPARQPARAVNTQADSLVSGHLLPGLGAGAGGQWAPQVRPAWLAARLEPPSPGRARRVSLSGDRQAGHSWGLRGARCPPVGPPGGSAGRGQVRQEGKTVTGQGEKMRREMTHSSWGWTGIISIFTMSYVNINLIMIISVTKTLTIGTLMC